MTALTDLAAEIRDVAHSPADPASLNTRLLSIATRLDALAQGPDLKAAYLLLEAHTKPDTYGRNSLEVLKDIAFPEAKAARDAAREDYCPYCLQWQGGPLLCCEDGYLDPKNLPRITKAEAERRRITHPGAKS